MNITAVAIVAIVCWALVEITTGRRHKKQSNAQAQESQQMQQEFIQLKERVEVLEKIVTDEKYDLNKAFDALNKDKVA